MTIHSVYKLFLAIVLVLLEISSPMAAPYKGAGSKVEAFGKVMGTYTLSLSFTEVCGEKSIYKKESEETAKVYRDHNQAIINELSHKINQLANDNGGPGEQQRLNSDIKKSLVQLKSQTKNAAQKAITDTESCLGVLNKIRDGDMDIKTKRSKEVDMIMDYTSI